MSDAAVSINASSFYVASLDGLDHDHTNPSLMHNDLGFPVRDFNMEPLPPDSAVMRGSPCHYPQWQLEVPLHEGSIVPRPTVNYDVEMGPILRMSTGFHSDQIATVGYSSGHLPSNTPLTLPTLPVEPQYMRVQQETRANNNRESRRNQQLAQRCRWEGCTSTRCFNREADLLRHVRYIHIAPQSYQCDVNGCLKSFNRGDNLKDHKLRVHGWDS